MRIHSNSLGETFWTLTLPEEFGSVEVSAICRKDGIEFGGELITWDQIAAARHAASPAPTAQAEG